MEKNKKAFPTVLSPSKGTSKRGGRGFSLSEIKAAGKRVETLKKYEIPVDYFRKSTHTENTEILKKLSFPSEKTKKRKPFVAKEKKRTPFKPKKEKVKPEPAKKKEPVKVKPKEEAPKEKKPKVKEKPSKKVKKEVSGIALTDLSGLGPATAKKFEELGVSCVEELIKEDPGELASLIKGCSEDRITKWKAEGEELLTE